MAILTYQLVVVQLLAISHNYNDILGTGLIVTALARYIL